MDFDLKSGNKCVVNGLCKFDLGEHLKQGIDKIGIVFNTDDHDEPGEHWVSMYVDCVGKNLKYPSSKVCNLQNQDHSKQIIPF